MCTDFKIILSSHLGYERYSIYMYNLQSTNVHLTSGMETRESSLSGNSPTGINLTPLPSVKWRDKLSLRSNAWVAEFPLSYHWYGVTTPPFQEGGTHAPGAWLPVTKNRCQIMLLSVIRKLEIPCNCSLKHNTHMSVIWRLATPSNCSIQHNTYTETDSFLEQSEGVNGLQTVNKYLSSSTKKDRF